MPTPQEISDDIYEIFMDERHKGFKRFILLMIPLISVFCWLYSDYSLILIFLHDN